MLSRRLPRRRALAAAGGSLAALALAACGEAESEAPAPPQGLSERLQQDLARARVQARTAPEARAPQRPRLPAPDARHPVTVAMFPSNQMGGRVFGQLVNGLLAAHESSERRYAYRETALDVSLSDLDLGLSSALDAVAVEEPDLVLYLQVDQADLVQHDKLLPLHDFLTSDTAFDPAAYWPNLLDVGRSHGVQHGLPVAASPTLLVFDQALARELHVDPPTADPREFTSAVLLDAAIQLHTEAPASGGIGSLGMLSIATSEPDQQGNYFAVPWPHDLLLAALGDVRGPNDDFQPLTSEPAVETARFMHAWVNDHRLAITDGSSTRAFRRQGRVGFEQTVLAFMPPNTFVSGERSLYPFPNFGSGRNPAFAHVVLGVLKSAKDPELAFDALRHLDAGLRSHALLPATRLSAEGIAARVPDLPPDAAPLVEDLMANAAYPNLSRREVVLITNGLIGGVVFGGQSPSEGMRAIVDSLRAEQAGA